ncbi:hypothetical protein FE257_003861 [Aspergillus nanangensis]|uniref:Uncharacterized protein n=1 Tax=Aspergillus nanangensis TaxID=2582783 RepID=A0AAD4CB43_ASPNN|nr:hypothetical protein FE257_003861 [Aspergillus nanangensis]
MDPTVWMKWTKSRRPAICTATVPQRLPKGRPPCLSSAPGDDRKMEGLAGIHPPTPRERARGEFCTQDTLNDIENMYAYAHSSA